MDNEDEDVATERSPLLSQSDSAASNSKPPVTPLVHSPRLIVVLLSFIIFVIMFGAFLTYTPSIRLYEDIICRHYYDNVGGEGYAALNDKIDEQRCKWPKIQEELAIVVGGLQFVDSVPGNLPW
jgi:hypothetical protein